MIWIDVDGPLANFHKAVCKNLEIPYPEKTVFHRDWLAAQFPGQTLSKIFERLHKNPRFWQDIEPTPYCAAMVAFLDEYVPKWGILTSVWRHPDCYAGKFEWVKKHLGRKAVERLVIVNGHKERLSNRWSHLTDDTRSTIDAWKDAHGDAFHYVTYSTDMVVPAAQQFEAWRQHIINIKHYQ